ncbi:CheY chemotaxis protein or a CheY-like REC (receiver) domain [Haladaptatus litoreus]|uniref:CheY chemotaxis protein or a CheY-like REC (Receiver) domain n=1 Tax=Haladaptatus litoreus TaxID=553468 RepID=A0A1N6X1T9_9EURY|nr:PAS domain-containing protein [Haladaptatus litoreus]SIQ96334.1 CheY chemotaxis protein or a CheY-like REC (receiver) domain [Haladaptatus litoreus]
MNDFLALGNLAESTPIRILHVDDDPARVRLSTTLLAQYLPDAEIHTETDPIVACNRLDTDLAVNCIVSDFDMGSMDGLEFLEAVRGRFPNLPFILFTGKGSEEIASEAISAGVTDYLQKAAGADQYAVLANRIENVVSQYRAEQAATSYQRRIHTVYERVTDAFFALDDEWRFTFINGRGERLLDKDEAELLGKSVWDEFPDAVNSQFEDEYRNAMETQQPTTFEAYFDPLETLFEVHAYPSEEGLSVFFRDITAEDRIRTEHRREKEVLEQVFEMSPVGVAILDAKGAITRANNRMVELLEITEEEITDRTYDSSQWQLTDKNGDPLLDENHPLRPVFLDETSVRGKRFGYESPSGKWDLYSVSAAPIHDENDELERVVVAVEAVSEV